MANKFPCCLACDFHLYRYLLLCMLITPAFLDGLSIIFMIKSMMKMITHYIRENIGNINFGCKKISKRRKIIYKKLVYNWRFFCFFTRVPHTEALHFGAIEAAIIFTRELWYTYSTELTVLLIIMYKF